jgi:cytosine/uracil/thiamine/allantoin permease
MAIATMGNQIAAGAYPFGNDISALAPRYVNIRRAAIFMSIFCIASNRIAPIVLLSNLKSLVNHCKGYSTPCIPFGLCLSHGSHRRYPRLRFLPRP